MAPLFVFYSVSRWSRFSNAALPSHLFAFLQFLFWCVCVVCNKDLVHFKKIVNNGTVPAANQILWALFICLLLHLACRLFICVPFKCAGLRRQSYLLNIKGVSCFLLLIVCYFVSRHLIICVPFKCAGLLNLPAMFSLRFTFLWRLCLYFIQ